MQTHLHGPIIGIKNDDIHRFVVGRCPVVGVLRLVAFALSVFILIRRNNEAMDGTGLRLDVILNARIIARKINPPGLKERCPKGTHGLVQGRLDGLAMPWRQGDIAWGWELLLLLRR